MARRRSKGTKRRLSSILSAGLELVKLIPGAGAVVEVVSAAAGVAGVLGVSHAGVSGGNFKSNKLTTAASSLAILLVLGQFGWIDLGAWAGVLSQLTGLIGAAGVGASLKK